MTYYQDGATSSVAIEEVIKRVNKLRAMTTERGASEEEAAAFAAKAAEIMEEHGLTMMELESSSGDGEKREKDAFRMDRTRWFDVLMSAVAASCFCYADTDKSGSSRDQRTFRLFGRASAVITAKITFEYLVRSVQRTFKDIRNGGGHVNRDLFCHGCAERLAERLNDRHARRLREQKEEAERRAREAAMRSSYPGAANALVLTLVDYEQRERDLNEDFRRGLAPGTTQRRREEAQARIRANASKYESLKASGMDDGVAYNIAYLGMGEERAREYEKEWLKKTRRRGFQYSYGNGRDYDRQQREAARKSSTSWRAGRDAGEKIGLDTQVGSGDSARRIK